MEERVAKLEAIADSTVAAVAALRTDMNERFRVVDTQLVELRRQNVDAELILSRLDTQATQITDLRQDMDRRFGQVEHRLDEQADQIKELRQDMDRRFGQVEHRLDEQAEQIKELRSELRYMVRWLFGTQFAIALFLLGLAAKIFYPT